MTTPIGKIEQLFIYPIKSCAGIPLQSAYAEPLGFANDRRMMLVDSQNRFLTQRKYHKMALIRPAMVEGVLTVASTLSTTSLRFDEVQFGECVDARIWRDTVQVEVADAKANQWFSDVLGVPCRLVRQGAQLRPIRPDYAGPEEGVSLADAFPYLLTSTASLQDLNRRLETPVTMQHFRPNIVVSIDEAFAEDQWRKIGLGEGNFFVKKACNRCILTTVDPEKGERRADREPFATLKTFRTRSDSEVYFGQNLTVEQPVNIRVGDALVVREVQSP